MWGVGGEGVSACVGCVCVWVCGECVGEGGGGVRVGGSGRAVWRHSEYTVWIAR